MLLQKSSLGFYCNDTAFGGTSGKSRTSCTATVPVVIRRHTAYNLYMQHATAPYWVIANTFFSI
jgi:hypothetical protein